jgi:hypothetical protein
MTISIYDNEGKAMVYTHKAGETFEIKRSKAVTTGAITYDGTEQSDKVFVKTAGELRTIAEKVNSGAETYAGKTIILSNDIDLNNEEWVPIGTESCSFEGNFDGNGKVISNLSINEHENTSDGYAYAGLFGVTGISADQHNWIKNLTIKNVNILSTGNIVSAAIAYPYYTDVENITVQGNIQITGGNYTAGILSYTRHCVNANNLTIEGAEGSFIKGKVTVGGVISDIQMKAGLTAKYSNFKASGLNISAENKVG